MTSTANWIGGDAIHSLKMALGNWPAAPRNDADGDGRATDADTLLILKAALANPPIDRNGSDLGKP